MKSFFIILPFFIASKLFAQSTETVTEERSSDWIKVTATTTSTKTSSTAVKKKINTSKKPPVKKEEESFDKTNQQVNRFKKG